MKFRFFRRAVLFWAASLLLASCAHDFRLMKVDERLNAYHSAMRWGAFETAMQFHKNQFDDPPDFELLRKVKVTAYRPIARQELDNGNTLQQTVEIRYVDADGLVEKSITDRQFWLYDNDKDVWFLTSKFPRFK